MLFTHVYSQQSRHFMSIFDVNKIFVHLTHVSIREGARFTDGPYTIETGIPGLTVCTAGRTRGIGTFHIVVLVTWYSITILTDLGKEQKTVRLLNQVQE